MHIAAVNRFTSALAIPLVALALEAGSPVPPRSITLAEARARAIASSPDLAALAAGAEAAAGAARQAGAWANPELEVELENFATGGGAVDPEQTTAVLSQRLELFGTRRLRGEAATAEATGAASDLEQRRRDVTAAAEQGFVAVLGAQELLALAEEGARVAAEVAAAVAALVEAGEVSPIEAARARADAERARIDVVGARRDLDLARRALATLCGAVEPDFERAEGTLAGDVASPAAATLDAAIVTSPALARLDAAVAAQEARREAAGKLSLPEITVSAGYRRFTGAGDGWVAAVALPLPLATSYGGAKAEAAANASRARSERAAAEASLRGALRDAAISLAAAREEVRLLREEVVPRVEAVFAAVDEGYRAGKFRLLDLLDARRTLTAARRDQVAALVRMNVARADLDRFLVPAAPVSKWEQP